MKRLIINTFATWLPLSVTIIFISGLLYLVAQQYIRLSANEIPLQYAEDTRYKLESNQEITSILKTLSEVDMQKSLAPFVIICDSKGLPVAGTVTLNGACPVPPGGVFAVARQQGENRISWQPKRGVRIAAVILPCNINGQEAYVLGGRSLREVEIREHFVFMQVAAGIIITLITTFVITLIIQLKIRSSKVTV